MSKPVFNSTPITIGQPLIHGLKGNISPIKPIAPPRAVQSKETAIPPILARIAVCESGSNQYNSNGTVKRGIVNPADIGLFQINEKANGATAKRLGYDIYTRTGNIKMALWLYKNQGTIPWRSSASCWLSPDNA